MQPVKIAFVVLALTTVALSSAQLVGRVRIGYGVSGNFTLADTSTGRLEGPEIGLDIPITLGMTPMKVYASPSILLGGRMSNGSDTDGEVYRLLLTTRASAPGVGFYTFAGAGISFSKARGGQFSSSTDYETVFGAGMPAAAFMIPNASFEVAWHSSPKGQLRGLTLGIAGSF